MKSIRIKILLIVPSYKIREKGMLDIVCCTVFEISDMIWIGVNWIVAVTIEGFV